MAASIDFQMRLDEALNINVFGPLRMLALAREMKKLRIFLHVSTSYVNSDKHGILIEEKIYESQVDPEDTIKEIKSIPPNMVHSPIFPPTNSI
jgi:nucleoside-diphosphate-sugar epimerase